MLLNIINTHYNGVLINYLTTRDNLDKIRNLVILIIFINFISLIVLYLYNIRDVSLKNKFSFALVEELNELIFKKKIININIYEPVYLSQRIEDDATEVTVFLIDNITGIVTNISTLIIVGYIFLRISIKFIILFVLFIPLYFITYTFLKGYIYKSSMEYKEKQNVFAEKFFEQFFLLEEDKTHVNKNRGRILRKYYRDFYLSLLKLTRLKSIFSISDNIISFFIQLCVLTLGALLIINKELSIGSFVVITIYYLYAIESFKYFIALGQQYQQYKVAKNRLQEILDIRSEVRGTICDDIHCISIYIDNLEHIIEKGKIYAIVGRNGSGDSDIMMTDTINPLKSKFKGFHKTFKQDDLGLSLSSFLLN